MADTEDDITRPFAKKYVFSIPPPDQGDASWKLPELSESVHSDCEFENPVLQKLKADLNLSKNSLNDFDIIAWHKHTSKTNPAGSINNTIRHRFHPELCTQAWCKFHEILCLEDIIPEHAVSSRKLNCVHLCEAPGAFICSINHYIKTRYHKVKYKWVANTLNPYYEGNDPDCCIADDRLIFRTLDSWCFGSDQTGDIFCQTTLEDLRKRADVLHVVHLVTADGSINCQENPENQEMDTAPLKYTEVCYALNTLTHGGSFVLKSFTMFEFESLCLMYILCCLFEKVSVRKPATSKPGNSEVYVIARNFHGKYYFQDFIDSFTKRFPFSSKEDRNLIPVSCIPQEFIKQHVECSSFFVTLQRETIEQNKTLFQSKSLDAQFQSYKQQVCETALEMMSLRKIPRNQGIIKSGILQGNVTSNVKLRPKLTGSFTERHVQHDSPKIYRKTCKKTGEKSLNLCWKTCSKIDISESLKLVHGKPLQSIRLSLFCGTEILVEHNTLLHNSASQVKQHDHLVIDPRVSAVVTDLASKIGGVHQIQLNSDFTQNWQQLATDSPDTATLKCVPAVNMQLHNNLSQCKLLLACVISKEKSFELDCQKHLWDIVSFVTRSLHADSSFICFIPSALTRLTSGLLWILCQCFEKYTFLANAASQSTPGAFLICLHCTDEKRHKHMVKVKEAYEDHDASSNLLEIIPIQLILQDIEFSAMLKTVNKEIMEHQNRLLIQN